MPALVTLKSFELWLYGLASGAIGAAASAVVSLLGVPVAHSLGVDVKPLDWRQIGMVALGAAVYTACAYLMKSPLPKKKETP